MAWENGALSRICGCVLNIIIENLTILRMLVLTLITLMLTFSRPSC